MGLGRNEELHISCDYKGREDDCPKECSRCAISIKTDGDVALSVNQLDDAIRQYKRAIFLEPAFAEAWCNLASTFGMKSEFHNALLAFNKALAVDPLYGKAMYGKAVTLRNLGQSDEALALVYDILQMYQSPEAEQLKADLMKAGARINAPSVNREPLQEKIRNYCADLLRSNQLLSDDGSAPIVEEIYQPEEFAKSLLAYCKKKYAAFGEQKIRSECIITSYYGAICATIFYYRDKAGITATTNYSYLNDHIDMEFTDVNAEKLLGTKAGEEKAEGIWELITPFIKHSNEIFRKEWELSDELILEAMKSAYKIGMLVAVREEKKKAAKRLPSLSSEKPVAGSTSKQRPLIHDVNDIYALASFIGSCVHIILWDDSLIFHDDSKLYSMPYLYYPTARGGFRIGLNLYDSIGMPQAVIKRPFLSGIIEVKEIYGVIKYSPTRDFDYILDDAFFIPSEKNINHLKPLPQSDQYTYCQLSDQNVRLLRTKDSKTATNITIPEKIGGYTVTEVGEFYGCEKLTTLSVPSTVQRFENGTFRECPCLQIVNLGAGIHEIGPDSFVGSDMIEAFHVAPGNSVYCSIDGVLVSADRKKLLRIPPNRTGKYVVPEGIQIIASNSFRISKLGEVVLPNSVIEIEDDAFYCAQNLRSITIPASVTTIADGALVTDGSFFFDDDNEETTHVTVITSKGSFAEQYAKENNYPIQYL